MTLVGSEEPLPAHRILLRAALGAAIAGFVAAPASMAPYLVVKALDHGWFSYGTWKPSLMFLSLWVAIRAFLLVLGEELARQRSLRLKILLPACLLLVVGYPLETWAMVWSAPQLVDGWFTVHPLEVLPDVLDRLTYPRVWAWQVQTLLPFFLLVLGRLRWGHTYGAVAALAGGVVAVMVSVALRGTRPETVMSACNWHLLPGMATGLALGFALAIERRCPRPAQPGRSSRAHVHRGRAGPPRTRR